MTFDISQYPVEREGRGKRQYEFLLKTRDIIIRELGFADDCPPEIAMAHRTENKLRLPPEAKLSIMTPEDDFGYNSQLSERDHDKMFAIGLYDAAATYGRFYCASCRNLTCDRCVSELPDISHKSDVFLGAASKTHARIRISKVLAKEAESLIKNAAHYIREPEDARDAEGNTVSPRRNPNNVKRYGLRSAFILAAHKMGLVEHLPEPYGAFLGFDCYMRASVTASDEIRGAERQIKRGVINHRLALRMCRLFHALMVEHDTEANRSRSDASARGYVEAILLARRHLHFQLIEKVLELDINLNGPDKRVVRTALMYRSR